MTGGHIAVGEDLLDLTFGMLTVVLTFKRGEFLGKGIFGDGLKVALQRFYDHVLRGGLIQHGNTRNAWLSSFIMGFMIFLCLFLLFFQTERYRAKQD